MFVQIRCLRLVSLEEDEIEMFIQDQRLWKEECGSRIGQREKSNCNEAWPSLRPPGRGLWSKYCQPVLSPAEMTRPVSPAWFSHPVWAAPGEDVILGEEALHVRPTLKQLTAGDSLLSKLPATSLFLKWGSGRHSSVTTTSLSCQFHRLEQTFLGVFLLLQTGVFAFHIWWISYSGWGKIQIW